MMEDIDRRSALALAASLGAIPILAFATPAAAATYGPDEGKEIAPGVRVVALGEREVSYTCL